jgi:hypothetical protein
VIPLAGYVAYALTSSELMLQELFTVDENEDAGPKRTLALPSFAGLPDVQLKGVLQFPEAPVHVSCEYATCPNARKISTIVDCGFMLVPHRPIFR